MDDTAITAAAALLAEHRIERRPLAELPADCRPRTEDETYAIQDAMNRLLASRNIGVIAGYKIGCTTPVMQQYMGIDHPGAGAILAPTVHDSPADLAFADYVAIGVEGEIAIRLAADLPPAGAPYDRDAIFAAIERCCTAIELVDARYVDYRSLDTWTMVADNFFNAGCILGTPVANWRGIDMTAVTGRMTVNGRVAGEGRGANVMGHPFDAAVWLANTMARRGLGLKAGEWVMTGSIVETQWLEQGDAVAFEIDALGGVTARFT
jgi:2-keto-4-pentenoate hydratase